MELLVNLISGALGGNVAGGLLKNHNLGLIGNSATGIVGGGLGGQVLSIFGEDLGFADGASAGLDSGLLTAQIAAGGAGGGVVVILLALIRNRLTR